MTEYRKRYVCPYCGSSTIYRHKDGGYACKTCSLKFLNPKERVVAVMRVVRRAVMA